MAMEGTYIVPLTEEMAREIASWRYPEPYDIYSLNPADSLEGLLDGSSYGLQNGKGQLVGFYQFGRETRILTKEPGAYPQGPMDLGLGLAPHLCGLSLGHRGGHELCSEGAESGKLSADSAGMESTG